MYKDDEDFLAATADCYGAAGAEYIEQAIVVFNKLIDKNPYNPAYWVGLAKCQFATKDFDKAIESCDFAIAADEEFGEAHIIKAHSLFHLENIEGAIVEYRKALKYTVTVLPRYCPISIQTKHSALPAKATRKKPIGFADWQKSSPPRMQSPTCSRDASIWKRTISTWPVQSGH